MKLIGGYTPLLKGKPSSRIRTLDTPSRLLLPLQTRRLNFSALCVESGAEVTSGAVLALDPDRYHVPLIAPMDGRVDLQDTSGHLVLNDVRQASDYGEPDDEFFHVPRNIDSVGKKRFLLLKYGAWHYFHDAVTGAIPDPSRPPHAVIVSTLRLEPFLARGDVQLRERPSAFMRGLEHLQSLLEYQPIYLVVPRVESQFAHKIRDMVRGYAWVKVVEVPLCYPRDDFRLIARSLKLISASQEGPVWALKTEGVFAVDQALTNGKPVCSRTIATGGPGVTEPAHVNVVNGYPVKSLLEEFDCRPDSVVINGGIFTGKPLGTGKTGIDIECQGITVMEPPREREFLGFMRPGVNRRSFSRSFLSALRPPFVESPSTALRGETRPCVTCGFCADVCPADIQPYWIHKLLFRDAIEEAEKARVDLCVGCGLCSFVCPSKIELRSQMLEAQETIARELHDEEGEEDV